MSTIKIVFKEDIRRIPLSKDTPFDTLLVELKRIYPKSFLGGLQIRYRDDEEDLVTVTSNMELHEALEMSGSTILKLFVTAKAMKEGKYSEESDTDEYVKVSKDGQRTALVSRKDATSDKKSQKQAEKAEKKAQKQAKKAEKEAKQAQKEADAALKEAQKAAKKAKKETDKAKKQAEKEAKKTKRQAEKEAEKQKKDFFSRLDAKFVRDITIPDEMEVEAGSKVTKTWLVKNAGKVAWPKGARLCKVAGKSVACCEDFKVPLIGPGEEAAISVELTVPSKPGKYKTPRYTLVYKGKQFGDNYWAVVVSKAKTPVNVKKAVWPVKKHTVTKHEPEAPLAKAPVLEKKSKSAVPAQKNKATYGAHFVKDLTIPDGALIAPGQVIEKVWLIKNTGDAAWPKNTRLVRLSGSTFGPDDVKAEFKLVGKGDSTRVSVRLTAPATTGIYTARYSLAQPNGEHFGHKYWVNIRVSKFPSRDQLKTLARQFLAEPQVVEALQTELPMVLSQVRQGKKISSIFEMLLQKRPGLRGHQFVIFIRPFLQSAEKFMSMQMDALVSMYSFWAMTPFAQGAAVGAATPSPVPEPVKESKVEKAAPPKKAEAPKAEAPKAEPYVYAKQLQHFEGMGFKDLKTVKRMLNKHKGSIQAVMNALFHS